MHDILNAVKHSFLVLFNSTTKKVGSINVTLEHLPLEATGKRFGEKKAQFNCFDKFCILSFGNIQH